MNKKKLIIIIIVMTHIIINSIDTNDSLAVKIWAGFTPHKKDNIELFSCQILIAK